MDKHRDKIMTSLGFYEMEFLDWHPILFAGKQTSFKEPPDANA